MIVQIVQILAGITVDFFKNKREEKQLKHQRRMSILETNAEWERQAQENAQGSWKDEYWTIVLSIPCIGSFIPLAVPYISAGFEALSTMPEWYIAALGISIASSFGFRALKTAKKTKEE